MTASLAATARSLPPLPRPRSRRGMAAGSSDRPRRSSPRIAGPGSDIWSPEFLANASAILRAQRSFRVQQLRELDTVPLEAAADPARMEIHFSLRAAAQSALRDIDAALRRIRRGSFGRCLTCGDSMSAERLDALPMASLCGRCHRATGVDAGTKRADVGGLAPI